jgi:hypothetical protein
MSTQAVGYPADRIERRRSERLPIRVVVIVCGDAERPFQEETSTFSLSAYGALVPLEHHVTIGQKLTVQNPENWAERAGRVTRLGACYTGRTEIGIEFVQPVLDFWPIGTRKD